MKGGKEEREGKWEEEGEVKGGLPPVFRGGIIGPDINNLKTLTLTQTLTLTLIPSSKHYTIIVTLIIVSSAYTVFYVIC